jgi:UDP-GlcNAc:undecaprenyl-phosphate/decaprenyl-phosphate GlcNAc-1-phosphate transferase
MSLKPVELLTVAFLVALVVTPLVMRLCFRFGVLDRPGALKIHTRPIPRLGGVAIAVAIVAGMLAAGTAAAGQWLLVAAFALVWFTGLVDDLRGLPPVARLAAQLVSAFLLWHACFGFPAAGSASLSLASTAFVAVLGINSLNFWDGSNGLAAGFAMIAALAFFLAPHQVEDPTAAALACGIAGSCAGFLIFNVGGAIFMGDSGSTLLGFALAFLTCDFYRSNRMTLAVATFPVFVCALPILDAALAIIRRLRNARSPVLGDRSHLYDFLLIRGCSARTVALTSFAITFVLAVLGCLSLWTGRAVFVALAALVISALFLAAVRLGALRTTKIQASALSALGEEVEARPACRE